MWFLAGGGFSRAGERTHWVWRIGEARVFVWLELQCEKVRRREEQTKHDAVAALVTRSQPSV